jgi:hypothetical protein
MSSNFRTDQSRLFIPDGERRYIISSLFVNDYLQRGFVQFELCAHFLDL